MSSPENLSLVEKLWRGDIWLLESALPPQVGSLGAAVIRLIGDRRARE
jgi:hypothetical protein